MASAESRNHSDFIRLWTAACPAKNYNKQAWMDVEGQLRSCGAIDTAAQANLRFNPFFCKTEGMRRLSIAVSFVALCIWTFGLAVDTKGFARDGAVLVAFAVPAVLYLMILIARSLFQWVAFGFLVERMMKR